MFKLLGIKIGENCDEKFHKVLKKGELYSFYKDRLELQSNGEIKVLPNKGSISDKLYEKIGNTTVSVHAIVGKNGSGKSTLIEIQAIFSFLIYKELKYNNKERYIDTVLESLKKQKTQYEEHFEKISDKTKINNIPSRLVENYEVNNAKIEYLKSESFSKNFNGFNCEVIFETEDSKVLKLKSSGGKLELKEYEKEKWTLDQDSNKQNPDFLLKSNNYFYTVLLNYSIYSFRKQDFGDWVEWIYHKNDFYTTPFLITPMKTDGTIDINSELNLQPARLLSSLIHKQEILNKQVTEFEFEFKKETEFFDFVLDLDNNKLTRKYSKSGISNYSIIKNNIILTFKDLIKKDLRFFFEGISFEENKLSNIEIEIIKYLLRKSFKYAFYIDVDKPIYQRNDEKVLENYKEYHNKILQKKSYMERKYHSATNLLLNENVKLKFNSENKLKISAETFADITKDYKNQEISFLEFLKIDFYFENESKNEFSKMSSGELQLSITPNTIKYHIRNIDNGGKYEYVNIVIDEVELYMHPEFQKSFVKIILDGLREIKFKNIKGINLTFITHSPFILSDIPSSNILRLKEGVPHENLNQTFAANIYDLLKDDFFMTGVIGDFAKEKINEIINGKIWDEDDRLKMIELIGDPLLKGVVKNKVLSRIQNKELIEKEIERLQNLLKN